MAIRQGGFDYREDAEFEDDLRYIRKEWRKIKKKKFGKKQPSTKVLIKFWEKFEKGAVKWLRSRHQMSKSDIEYFTSGIHF